jgi:hypothetical protein
MHLSTRGVDLLYVATCAIRMVRHADLLTTTLSAWSVEGVTPLTTLPTVCLQAGTDQAAGATRAAGFGTRLKCKVFRQYNQSIISIIGGWGVCGHRTHPNLPLIIEMIQVRDWILQKVIEADD